MKYPYAILGVEEDASDSDIRAAYLQKIQRFSPEEHPKQFQEITEAFSLIRDEISRAKLSVFGMLPNNSKVRLSSFMTGDDHRKRVGVDAWLDLIKQK